MALSAGNSVAIELGAGNGTFSAGAPVSLSGTVFPIAMVSGDFNRDGIPDLAVAYDLMVSSTADTGNLAILLGKGNGTFQTPVTIALAGVVRSLAAGDVNKDGKLDLIAGIQVSTGDQLAVFLGNGNGTFQSPSPIKTGTTAASVSVTDLNGDGNPDLLLGDCCGLSEATFMLGNGDGTFQTEHGFPSGPNPAYMALGSLNGSTKPDLAIAGNGNGHGTFVALRNNFPAAAAVVSAANSNGVAIAPSSLATAYGAGFGKRELRRAPPPRGPRPSAEVRSRSPIPPGP